METEDTRVVFKMTREKFPQCVAFLLDVESSPNTIMTYMHVGQHGEASVEFAKECRLAKPEEFSDLKEELESIGYNLFIREKVSDKLFGKKIITK